ncbi:MAG: hypothetical protein EA393_01790 [Bacteroidetes bacterium]|nr:MAG: hypothetical protein EA393_01790 [Bacteroidota bacterium]
MHNDILKTILYFDVFSYPLKEEEVVSYSRRNRNDALILQALNELKKQGVVKYQDGYYFVGDPSKIERRKQGNMLAKKRMRSAMFYSRIISRFPYVRGIMLSGSISKGYMGEKDDIDYFIVTQPGRLWITRTFLTVFKKIFLRNSYRNFCINFFVDSENLEIKEKSRYSATEIIFLLPVFKSDLYYRLIKQNFWVKKFYPEFEQKNNDCIENEILVKRWIEKLLNNRFGDKFENFLFEKSVEFIQKKFAKMDNQSFENSFRLKRNELRYFPEKIQMQISDDYSSKLKKYEKKLSTLIFSTEPLNYSLR